MDKLEIGISNFEEYYLKCPKCLPQDHTGQFCRCENRNMIIAKEARKRGKSSWVENEG